MDYTDPNEERRRRLVEALKRSGGASRLLGGGARALPLFGGAGRGSHSSMDFPAGALPQLSFNPFLAQQARFGNFSPPGLGGAPAGGIAPPTSALRVSDNSGLPAPGGPPAGVPGGGAGGFDPGVLPQSAPDGQRILYGDYGAAQPQQSIYDILLKLGAAQGRPGGGPIKAY